MMRLSISHKTVYEFSEPPKYGLQQLRLTPKDREGQSCTNWSLGIEGGDIQAQFHDQNNNQVCLVSLTSGVTSIEILSQGFVDMENRQGIIGPHKGFAPLWYFERETALTQAGKGVRALLKGLAAPLDNSPNSFHALSAHIAKNVIYETGKTGPMTRAEDALALGSGVCQDHAHIFISAARLAGFPARYISGYLMMNDRIAQEATHAWAEVFLQDLGWVGFDVSNGISPDERYVRVASGLDYSEAAPISGMIFGGSGESLSVTLDVQQQ